jgi:hypothetical protein
MPKAMFIWLIIRLIQLVFLAETVFFSHKKSANSIFQPAYNSSRTAPKPAFIVVSKRQLCHSISDRMLLLHARFKDASGLQSATTTQPKDKPRVCLVSKIFWFWVP